MIQIYESAKSELSYTATRFLQMVMENGGVETARRLLLSSSISDGFTTLWEKKRLDLSVEALVIKSEYVSLFTADELAIARDRLQQFGYSPPTPA